MTYILSLLIRQCTVINDGILFKRILNMRGNKVYDCAF